MANTPTSERAKAAKPAAAEAGPRKIRYASMEVIEASAKRVTRENIKLIKALAK